MGDYFARHGALVGVLTRRPNVALVRRGRPGPSSPAVLERSMFYHNQTEEMAGEWWVQFWAVPEISSVLAGCVLEQRWDYRDKSLSAAEV